MNNNNGNASFKKFVQLTKLSLIYNAFLFLQLLHQQSRSETKLPECCDKEQEKEKRNTSQN